MLWTVLAAKSTTADDPFGAINDFFHSSTWHFIVRMAIFFVVVLWAACAYWIYKDAKRRIDDRVIIIVAVLTGVVFGPLGALVYSIVRPPEYLDDVRERELEIRAMEQRLADDLRCPYCKTPVRDDFLVCPTCTRRLRSVCPSCRRPVEPEWRVCPYCEEPLRTTAASFGVR